MFLLQDLSRHSSEIIQLGSLTIVLLALLCLSQLPSLLTSDHFAASVSIASILTFSIGLYFVSNFGAVLILFGLLLAVQAMFPISRMCSAVVSILLIIGYVVTFLSVRLNDIAEYEHYKFRKVSLPLS